MASIVSLLVITIEYTNDLVEKIRTVSLAENVSIAAADSLRGLVAGSPCDVAKEVAKTQSANVLLCSIIGRDVLIELERAGTRARSRAGSPE